MVSHTKRHQPYIFSSAVVHQLFYCNSIYRGRVVCIISPSSVAFGVYYVKEFEDTPIHSASEMYPKNLVFSGISFTAIFAGNHPQRGR